MKIILYVVEIWEGKLLKGDINEYYLSTILKLVLEFILLCEDFLRDSYWGENLVKESCLGGD